MLMSFLLETVLEASDARISFRLGSNRPAYSKNVALGHVPEVKMRRMEPLRVGTCSPNAQDL